tara:strand:- start:239 stop:484 length:246 start_codon:yes stop_codon:yes gene_type:complete
MSKNKLNKEELSSLRNALSEFNQAKVRLADTVMHQHALMSAVQQMRNSFQSEEKKLLDKYGNDSRINLETGEVTAKEKVNG